MQTSPRLAALGPLAALLAATLAAHALPTTIGTTGPADGWDLAEPAPAIPFEPATLEGLESFECNDCHADVVAEWASSAHGLAWVDAEYREALEDRRRPQQCYDCHIPRNLFAGGTLTAKLEPREEDRDHGISCDSCHLGPDGAYLGPWGAPTAAHASAKSELHAGAGSDALCITCHDRNVGPVIGIAKDFEKSYAGQGETCVGCHMAPVERRWGLPAEGEEPPPVRAGRSHALQTVRDPGFLRRAFELSVERTDAGCVVVVANRAGHRVPGLIGREIELTAELLDADGKTLAEGELTIDKRGYLPARGEKRLELASSKPGVEVRVRGAHDAPRAPKPIEFLDERLPLP